MAAPVWIDRGALPTKGPASPYVLWATAGQDRRGARAPEGKAHYHIGELCGIAEEDKARPTSGSMTDYLAHVLAADFGQWNLVVPSLLPRDVLRPDLRDPPEAAPAPRVAPRLGPPLPAGSVFIGVVDDTVAFGHQRFRRADGTSRVDYLWVQGAPHRGDALFGREYHAEEIDGLMAASRRPGGTLDEEGLYRRAGLIDMARPEPHSAALRASHGTAVLDVAGGGLADHFPLAVVTLPPQVTRDTSGTFAAVFVIAGVLRILDHVERCSAPGSLSCPVVINLSLGLTAGSKDGRGVVEDFLAKASTEWEHRGGQLRFVLPSGNHRLARTHAALAGPLTMDDPPLAWRLLPDDRTPSFLEVWSNRLDRPADPRLTVALAPPGAPEPVPVPEPRSGHFSDLHGAGGRLLARAWFQWRPDDPKVRNGSGRERITVAVPPTAPAEPGATFVPPGDWRLLVEPTPGAPDEIWPADMFIQRDDAVPGYRGRGRQSRFQDHRYVIFEPSGRLATADSDSYVRRAGTLNAFAAADAPVVVGGCYERAEPGYADEVEYSGAAFDEGEREWWRPPELTAPCERSRVRRGIRAAGSRSGSRIAIAGTSIAAPAVACRLACAFAALPGLRPQDRPPKLLGLETDSDPRNPGRPPSLRF